MRITDKDILIFTKNLAVMVKANLSLAQAIKTQIQQSRNPSFRRALLDITRRVEEGEKFSTALERQPHAFGFFYVNVVRAAEKSGTLENNLEYLADHIETSIGFKKTLTSALIYPTFMLCAVGAVAVVLGYTVLPTVTELLASLSESPPLATRMVLAFTAFLSTYGIAVIFAIVACGVSAYFFIRTPSGKNFFDRAMLHLPIVGGLVRRVYLARSAKVFATLLKSGVPIHESLAITAGSLGNDAFQAAIRRVIPGVLKGGTVSAFLDRKLFPPLFIQMLEVGEKSASIEKNLDFLASFYQKEVESSVKNLFTLIEPILLVIVGIVVLFLALAVIGPIYQSAGQ
ncbi:MAG: type II secretion system F family protein [Candidatus Azambacteria bacterium]|nr:type II secretion system F family protein [Candidatus Azambacteria bacterium]